MHEPDCDNDCTFSQWSAWGACDTAGVGDGAATNWGMQYQTREITQYPEQGGKTCQVVGAQEAGNCDELSNLGPEHGHSPGHAVCGEGAPIRRGRACGHQWEEKTAELADWSEWGWDCPDYDPNDEDATHDETKCSPQCSNICGGGHQVRHRPAILSFRPGDAEFDSVRGMLKGFGPNDGHVKADVPDGNWHSKTHMTKASAVNSGEMHKVPAQHPPGQYDGFFVLVNTPKLIQLQGPAVIVEGAIEGDVSMTQLKECGDELSPCCDPGCDKSLACEWGDWQEWGACDAECGGGVQYHYRHVVKHPRANGKHCDKQGSYEVQQCNTHECGKPSYCEWHEWTDWGPCSQTCGAGLQSKTRTMFVTAVEPADHDDILQLIDHPASSPHTASKYELEAMAAEIATLEQNLHATKTNFYGLVAALAAGIGVVFATRRRATVGAAPAEPLLSDQ